MADMKERPCFWPDTPESARKNVNILFNFIQAARVDVGIMRGKANYAGIVDRDLVSVAYALAQEVNETFGPKENS